MTRCNTHILMKNNDNRNHRPALNGDLMKYYTCLDPALGLAWAGSIIPKYQEIRVCHILIMTRRYVSPSSDWSPVPSLASDWPSVN